MPTRAPSCWRPPPGNERKTSGSYYTPDSLVQCLLDSALEPVIAERLTKAKDFRGKGKPHCSVSRSATRRSALGTSSSALGTASRNTSPRVRSGEEEPSPGVYRTALRDVIGRCLYGVDANPMSAELCRVSLWLEALEPGKPPLIP